MAYDFLQSIMKIPDPGRMFLAFWPDQAVRERIAQVVDRRLAKTGRPVVPDNLHLTLVFLGLVETAQLQQLLTDIGGLVPEPMELVFDRLGWWPDSRVLWLAPNRIPGSLTELVEKLKASVNECGIPVDKRPFRAHITLVRKVRQLPSLPEIEPVQWHAHKWVLVRSNTRPEGVRYTPVWTSGDGLITEQD